MPACNPNPWPAFPSSGYIRPTKRLRPSSSAHQERETDFYIMLCPVYLFSTCCCFKQSSLRLTVPSCCLSYCTELAVAESSKKPEPMQHLRLVRFFLHISSVACHICALINPSMCLHSWSVRSLGLCFNAISGRVLQES